MLSFSLQRVVYKKTPLLFIVVDHNLEGPVITIMGYMLHAVLMLLSGTAHSVCHYRLGTRFVSRTVQVKRPS